MAHPESLDLGDRIAEQAAHLDAATHRLLTDLRVFDESGAWHKQGSRSCASWLSWRVGWDMRTANEHVRVANRLGKLPKIDDSLRRGEMSYAKVRAMVRVATPENEEMLLEEARYSTGGQLEKICRQYASVRRHDHDVAPNDDQKRRYLVRRDTADGMVKIEGLYHPEEAALIWAAVERIASERCREREDARRAEERAQAAGNNGSVNASPDSPGSAEPTESSNPKKFQKHIYPSGFDRADALLALSEQVLRGTSPERAPIDLVLTASVDALTRPFISLAAGASSIEDGPGKSLSAGGIENGVGRSFESDEPKSGDAHCANRSPCGDPTCTHERVEFRPRSNDGDSTIASDPTTQSEVPTGAMPPGALPMGMRMPPQMPMGIQQMPPPSMSKATMNTDLIMRALIALQKTNPLAKTLGDYVQSRIADPVPVTWIHPSEMFDEVAFDPEEVGLLGDGTCISSTAARRLACDCGLTSVLESEHGTPITIGRKRRTIPASMKRALLRRDCTCRFPGCGARAFLQGHHMEHWLDGGATELANLVSLCGFHHRYVHEYGYRVELTCDGEVRFIDPRGQVLKNVPDRPSSPDLGWPAILVGNAGLGITHETCACGWNGGPVDYHLCVDALIAADEGRVRYPL